MCLPALSLSLPPARLANTSPTGGSVRRTTSAATTRSAAGRWNARCARKGRNRTKGGRSACRPRRRTRWGGAKREIDLPLDLADYLPTHPNVVVESGDGRTQRGFFPSNSNLAIANGLLWVATLDTPFIGPVAIYVSSVVREDPVEGECTFTDVSKQRHDTVEERTVNTVNTRDPWHRYHVVERNSIAWANEVLR